MTSIHTTHSFPSLQQGKRYQTRNHSQAKHLENSSAQREGFVNGSLMDKTTNVVNQNDFSKQQDTIDALRREYQTTLERYQALTQQMSNNVTDYVSRVSSNNPYINKTIKFTTGQIAYVTNQGVVKLVPSLKIQNSVNIPKQPVDVSIPWVDAYATPGTSIPTTPPLVSGTFMKYGQSVGHEGTNVFVNKLLPPTITPTYKGCFASNPSIDFIGDKPNSVADSRIENGDFSQPVIKANTHQYITGSSVPGWYLNKVAFLNNSTAWGYPMPYPNGNQCVSIQNGGYMNALLPLTSGVEFTLTFYACGRNCCTAPTAGNTINIQLYTSINAFISQIYTFTPPIDNWTAYNVTFTVPTTQTYKLYFTGTNASGDRSSAIQNISLSNRVLQTGAFSYESCQDAAIANEYRFFGLQDVNTSTGLGYCAVSNSEPALSQYGPAYTVSKVVALWSSKTFGQSGSTAVLSKTGSLQVLNASGQAIFSSPAKSANSTFVGCYGDKETRAMANVSNDQYVPFEDCKQLAKDGSYKYFGTQNASDGKGWCVASNELSEVTQYGVASNCTAQNGNQMGGPWSNAVYSVDPDGQYYMLLEDGNMSIYRGASPTDNQGLIWQTGTAGQQLSANPNTVATNGKFGRNWMASGDTLSPGDFVGSNDGTIALVMQGDGNLVLYTYQVDTNCAKIGERMGGRKGANAIYDIGMTAFRQLVGQLGFIDNDSTLYTYPNRDAKYTNTYTVVRDATADGQTITGASFSDTTVDACKTACNNIPDCNGFAFDKQTNTCIPKKSLKRRQTKPSANTDLYLRDKIPSKLPTGVPATTANIDTIQYKRYINKGAVGTQYGLSTATSSQQQELEQLQTRMDMISSQITHLTNRFQTGTLVAEQQSADNTSGIGDYLTDLKQTNVNIVDVAKNTNGNVRNILKDSDIVVLQKNYEYLFWSILAAGTVLVSMSVIQKP